MEKLFDLPKNFVGPEKILDPLNGTLTEIFLATGGGEEKGAEIKLFHKQFSGLVGHNPKKSGKFLSAPLIFSFPYAHASPSPYTSTGNQTSARLSVDLI
jgi:hypothetical protein